MTLAKSWILTKLSEIINLSAKTDNYGKYLQDDEVLRLMMAEIHKLYANISNNEILNK